MPEDWKRALEHRLADVPRGEVLIRAASGAPLFPPPACACIGRDEKGRLDIWPLYPGVELTLQAYSAKSVAFHHDVSGAAMLEINHCYAGRVGYTSGAEPALYLGAGDLSLHGLHTGVESVMQFPFDGYLGFSFRVDVARLDEERPAFMREAGVSGAQILARFCGENGFSVLSSAEQVGALLDALHPARAPADSIRQAQVSGADAAAERHGCAARDPKRLSGGADRAHSADSRPDDVGYEPALHD